MMTRRARSEAIHWTKKREPNVSCPRKPIAYHVATDEKRLFMSHPPNLVTQHPRFEPADSDEVANSTKEPVSHAILGYAMAPRAMPHRHLDDPSAAELAERGKEPMRAGEEREVFERFPAIGLERAANVADRVPDRRAPDHVRDSGRGAAPPGVRPVRPHARNDVGVAERVEEQRDRGGVVLAVGIQRDDHAAPRVPQPGRERAALSDVLLEQDAKNAGIPPRALFDPSAASVRAPVVDEDQLVGRPRLFEHLSQFVHDFGKTFHLVEYGDDHGDLDLLGSFRLYEMAQRFAPASSSVGSPSGNSPSSLRRTISR